MNGNGIGNGNGNGNGNGEAVVESGEAHGIGIIYIHTLHTHMTHVYIHTQLLGVGPLCFCGAPRIRPRAGAEQRVGL